MIRITTDEAVIDLTDPTSVQHLNAGWNAELAGISTEYNDLAPAESPAVDEGVRNAVRQ